MAASADASFPSGRPSAVADAVAVRCAAAPSAAGGHRTTGRATASMTIADRPGDRSTDDSNADKRMTGCGTTALLRRVAAWLVPRNSPREGSCRGGQRRDGSRRGLGLAVKQREDDELSVLAAPGCFS